MVYIGLCNCFVEWLNVSWQLITVWINYRRNEIMGECCELTGSDGVVSDKGIQAKLP